MELPNKTVLNTFCSWTWTKMSRCCYSLFKKEPGNSCKACNVRLGMMRFKTINYGWHAVQPKYLYLKSKMTTFILFYSSALNMVTVDTKQDQQVIYSITQPLFTTLTTYLDNLWARLCHFSQLIFTFSMPCCVQVKPEFLSWVDYNLT